MRKNILMRTNLLVCVIIVVGFLLTSMLSYRANYSKSLESIRQVSDLTSEGIYYQMSSTFTKPVNISLTMANDSLLREYLLKEQEHLNDANYIDTIRRYLGAYQKKYNYDSVFLVSTVTQRYYNFNGLDRVLTPDNPENEWYYSLLKSNIEYSMKIDNDEVEGAQNRITVFVNCKIKDALANIVGVVGVGLRVDSLQQLLQDYQDEFGVKAYLIDNEGVIEISTAYTGYEAVNFFDVTRYGDQTRREILEWQEEGADHSFWTAGDENEESYIVTRYLPELKWHLVVEYNTGSIRMQLLRQLVFTVIIISVILVGILFTITHVIRSFNRQIVALMQTMEQERKTMFEKATEQLYENIYELDITHNRSANQATEKYFESLGAPEGTPYDKALRIIAEQQIKAEFRQGYVDTFSPENVSRAYQNGQETLKYDFQISKDGQNYYWMRITARLIPWESDGSLHMMVYRQNIDAEKRREKQMQQLAQTDEMTGLLTKTATQRQIEQMLRDSQSQSCALFIFDIDCFKQANDRFGHAFGDAVIQSFVRSLRQHFRRGDLLGRIGGDEFAAFLEAPSESWVLEKAEELSAALYQIYCEDGKSWQISSSIGVAFAPREGNSWDSFYQMADTALYWRKENGKNGFTLYRHEICRPGL